MRSPVRCAMYFVDAGAELQGLGVRPSRKLGQNFLTDEDMADWIVTQAGIQSNERLLEIGPGLGILTRRLAKLTDNLTAIELDRRLAWHIQEIPNVHVIQADALEVEFPPFDKVVSNLPYQISSPLTLKLLDASFKKGILMYQKEFAEHLVAQPGERAYSRISVMAGCRACCRILRQVPKGCFHPVPKIDSAIVEIVPKKPDFEVLDEETFKLVVRALFSHKNRKVRNGIGAEWRALGLDKKAARVMAEELPHRDRRPVNLSAAELAEIANHIFKD